MNVHHRRHSGSLQVDGPDLDTIVADAVKVIKGFVGDRNIIITTEARVLTLRNRVGDIIARPTWVVEVEWETDRITR